MFGHARDEIEGRTGVVCLPEARTAEALKVDRTTGPFVLLWHYHHSGASLGGLACGNHLNNALVNIVVQLTSYLVKEVERDCGWDVDSVGPCVMS